MALKLPTAGFTELRESGLDAYSVFYAFVRDDEARAQFAAAQPQGEPSLAQVADSLPEPRPDLPFRILANVAFEARSGSLENHYVLESVTGRQDGRPLRDWGEALSPIQQQLVPEAVGGPLWQQWKPPVEGPAFGSGRISPDAFVAVATAYAQARARSPATASASAGLLVLLRDWAYDLEPLLTALQLGVDGLVGELLQMRLEGGGIAVSAILSQEELFRARMERPELGFSSWTLLGACSTLRGPLQKLLPRTDAIDEAILSLLTDLQSSVAGSASAEVPTAEPSEPSESLAGEVRPGTSISSDAWTANDRLDYELYADAIVAFILDERTRAPLTIGIKAPWGAGKTSLMRMIRRRLDPEAQPAEGAGGSSPASHHPRNGHAVDRREEQHLKVLDLLRDTRGQTPEQAARNLAPGDPLVGGKRTTIWFNAWKYQSSEQLWAGLAHAIVSQLERRMTPLERERFWASLHVRRLHPGAVRRAIYRTLITRLLPWLVAGAAGGIVALAGLLLPGIALGSAAAVGAVSRWLSFLREDVAAASPELVQDPGYEGRLGFLHLVDEDMKRILALASATRQNPLVIFVDDLDRCSYTTVAQVIEALNVFLAGDFENCIFIIAMEPDLVAAQIHVAYEKLFSRMEEQVGGDLGWRFLEKMVQLPIALPPPQPTRIDDYVDSILGSREQHEDTVEPADLDDDALEVQEIQQLFEAESVDSALDVQPALERVRARASETGLLTPRHEAALRKVGRREFAQRLTEHDPQVRMTLHKLAAELPPNPREIKRFINVFRFYAYIQYWRNEAGLPAPTLDGVAKLALVTVRYPHLLSALGNAVGNDDSQQSLLTLLEAATDQDEWIARAGLAPQRLRKEVEETQAIRRLLTREPHVGAVAAGFL